jgi:hypothetical protein
VFFTLPTAFPQILKLAPCGGGRHHARRPPRLIGLSRLPALRGTAFDIGAAIGAVYIHQGAVGPPGIERQHTLLGFLLAGVTWGDVAEVDREHIGDQDFRGMTAAPAVGLVLVGEVCSPRARSERAVWVIRDGSR